MPTLLIAMPPLAKVGATEPIVALGKLGPDAKPALPELEKLKGAESEVVRRAAGEAVRRVTE